MNINIRILLLSLLMVITLTSCNNIDNEFDNSDHVDTNSSDSTNKSIQKSAKVKEENEELNIEIPQDVLSFKEGKKKIEDIQLVNEFYSLEEDLENKYPLEEANVESLFDLYVFTKDIKLNYDGIKLINDSDYFSLHDDLYMNYEFKNEDENIELKFRKIPKDDKETIDEIKEFTKKVLEKIK